MVFDYKKEYRDLYQPASEPSIITVPRMNFVAVEGAGDPNETGGAYQTAVQLLYGISYTIKMSKKAKDPSQRIDGYFSTTWFRPWRGCGGWMESTASITRTRHGSAGSR